jgi:uncharacterized membrane protein YfcA
MGLLLLLFATGLISGILGALMGFGGGIFLVPSLTLLFDLPIQIAVGTSLVGVIATSAGVAAAAGRGRGADVTLALRLEVATAAGAITGGMLAGVVSHHALSVLFAGVVFLTAAYTIYKGRQRSLGEGSESLYSGYSPQHWPVGLSVSFLAGLVSGLLGVGGGFIKVPIMYAIMDVPLGIATATSNFMVGITAAASVFVYYGRGEVRPLIVIPTALGVFAGAIVGAYLLPRLRVPWLRKALIALLILIGIQMLLHGLGF